MLDFIFCSVSEEDFKHESQNYRSFSVISNDFRNNSLQFSVKLFIAVQFLSLRTRTNDVFYVKMNAHCPLPCQSKKKNFFFREINCHLFLTLTLAWKIRENTLQWYVVVSIVILKSKNDFTVFSVKMSICGKISWNWIFSVKKSFAMISRFFFGSYSIRLTKPYFRHIDYEW